MCSNNARIQNNFFVFKNNLTLNSLAICHILSDVINKMSLQIILIMEIQLMTELKHRHGHTNYKFEIQADISNL